MGELNSQLGRLVYLETHIIIYAVPRFARLLEAVSKDRVFHLLLQVSIEN
jgi:hypothetical protein